MNGEFPGAIPEIPVNNVDEAAVYYEKCFGFLKDWGGEDGGIGQVSKRKLQNLPDQQRLSQTVRKYWASVDLAQP